MNATLPRLTSFRVVQPRLQWPVMRGVIERRMLMNFRCEPEVVARLLPAPFRPKVVRGRAVAGICLIRLGEIRPGYLPRLLGLSSENAAHRIAVEWDGRDEVLEGVFIPRRDTSSRLNTLAGGRLFPGEHHRAGFKVCETTERFHLEMRAADGGTEVHIVAKLAADLPADSLFRNVEEASQFFRAGALGWSARARAGAYDGLELSCSTWRVEPLEVERVQSSYFGDPTLFPHGSTQFDCALLMRGIEHEWHARGRMVRNDGGTP